MGSRHVSVGPNGNRGEAQVVTSRFGYSIGCCCVLQVDRGVRMISVCSLLNCRQAERRTIRCQSREITARRRLYREGDVEIGEGMGVTRKRTENGDEMNNATGRRALLLSNERTTEAQEVGVKSSPTQMLSIALPLLTSPKNHPRPVLSCLGNVPEGPFSLCKKEEDRLADTFPRSRPLGTNVCTAHAADCPAWVWWLSLLQSTISNTSLRTYTERAARRR